MTAATITHPNLHVAGADAGGQRQEFKTIMGWPPPAVPSAPPAVEAGRPDGASADGPAVAERRARLAKPRPAAGRKVGSVHAFRAGESVAGKYRLEGRIADGGMGGVWSAIDVESGRAVVVKLMNVELRHDDDAVKRFEQEAQAMAAVRSPHVCELVDHGVIEGTPYLVLERLRGQDLAQRLERGPLPLDECARLLDQMALALSAAHGAGIIHRDIKPANIFLATSGDDDVAPPVFKLLDFGIAKLQNHARIRTAAGVTIGSPHFMSPEQVQGVPDLDGRSDLFALAAVLYGCVTGKLPFHGADLSETFQRILRNQFDPPSAIAPGVPAELDAFFAKALALEPDDRWPTADAMARAFRDVVDEARGVSTVRTPSIAPPPPAPAARATSSRPAPSDRPSERAASASEGAVASSSAPPAGSASARPPSIDPPALRAFGAATQAALRAHLVAPLARPAKCEAATRRTRKNLAYAAAALLSVVITAGAVWQWSHERTAEDRPQLDDIPAATEFVFE